MIPKEFKKKLGGNRLLILGEIHGAESNPRVINDFVKSFGIRSILIEVESRHKKAFGFLKNGNPKRFLKALKKDNWIFDAGVVGAAHLKLFQNYLKKGINIIPAKIESRNWNAAESKTARNIEKILAKIGSRGPALLVFGRLHARKTNFRLNRKSYKPLGALLRDNAVSIGIHYGRGEVFNFRKIKIKDENIKKFISKGAKGLTASNNRYFDYFYIIPNTKAIKLVKYPLS